MRYWLYALILRHTHFRYLTCNSVDHYPVEDEKLRASGIFHRRGGNCPNTLEVLQQLLDFQRVETVSLILSAVLPSKSSAGTQKFESSFGPRIDLTHCIYREDFNEPASSYITKSRSTGSRTIVNYNELPEMTYEEFIIMVGRLDNQDSWFHFEVALFPSFPCPTISKVEKGRIPEVVLDCMRYLRQNYSTVKISVEVEKPGRGGLQALAAEADVVFYSKTWAQVESSDMSLLSDIYPLNNRSTLGQRFPESRRVLKGPKFLDT